MPTQTYTITVFYPNQDDTDAVIDVVFQQNGTSVEQLSMDFENSNIFGIYYSMLLSGAFDHNSHLGGYTVSDAQGNELLRRDINAIYAHQKQETERKAKAMRSARIAEAKARMEAEAMQQIT